MQSPMANDATLTAKRVKSRKCGQNPRQCDKNNLSGGHLKSVIIIIIIIIIIILKIERKSNASGKKKIFSIFCHCNDTVSSY